MAGNLFDKLVNVILLGGFVFIGYEVWMCYQKVQSADPLTILSCGFSQLGNDLAQGANYLKDQIVVALGGSKQLDQQLLVDLAREEVQKEKTRCLNLSAKGYTWNDTTNECKRFQGQQEIVKADDPENILRHNLDPRTKESFITTCKNAVCSSRMGNSCFFQQSDATFGPTVGQPSCALVCPDGFADCFSKTAWRTQNGTVIYTPLHQLPPS